MKDKKCFTFFLSENMPGTVVTAETKATSWPSMLIFKELNSLVERDSWLDTGLERGWDLIWLVWRKLPSSYIRSTFRNIYFACICENTNKIG